VSRRFGQIYHVYFQGRKSADQGTSVQQGARRLSNRLLSSVTSAHIRNTRNCLSAFFTSAERTFNPTYNKFFFLQAKENLQVLKIKCCKLRVVTNPVTPRKHTVRPTPSAHYCNEDGDSEHLLMFWLSCDNQLSPRHCDMVTVG
jgi:hypothetical protein